MQDIILFQQDFISQIRIAYMYFALFFKRYKCNTSAQIKLCA
jgi:hypothetical protein